MARTIEDAFEEFVRNTDNTLTPAAFFRWLRKHETALIADAGMDEAKRFAREKLGYALRRP